MKNKLTNLFNRMLSNKGYTIDQTILIVAIIAILITLVIVTVGWQLINRAGGTKSASQIKQVAEANGQFFSEHRVWPHQAYTAPTVSSAANVSALTRSGITTWSTNIDQTKLSNLLPGFAVAGTAVTHNLATGAASTVLQQPQLVNGEQRMVIQFANVPFLSAQEADINIDGNGGAAAGQLYYGSTACLGTVGGAMSAQTAATGGAVFMCLIANSL